MDRSAPRPHLKGLRDWLSHIFYGICIGAADVVPGISGGTMALILGIYEDLIFSVKSFATQDALGLFKLKLKSFHKNVSWDFLLALVIGAIIALGTLSQVIQYILGHEVYRVYLYSGFVGMILASVYYCFYHLHYWHFRYLLPFFGGAFLAFLLTGVSYDWDSGESHFHVFIPIEQVGRMEFQEKNEPNEIKNYDIKTQTFGAEFEPTKNIKNYDIKTQMLQNISESTLAAMLAKEVVTADTLVEKIGDGKISQNTQGTAGSFVTAQAQKWLNPWYILCGAIAISAMLLPGISGSYLLTILGVYPVAIGAVADFVRTADFDAFLILANLMVGIVIGALISSGLISWMLRHYHNMTISFLIGCMLGALRAVWPFWTYSYQIDPLRILRGPQLVIETPYKPAISESVFWYAFGFVCIGYFLVWSLERIASVNASKKKAR